MYNHHLESLESAGAATSHPPPPIRPPSFQDLGVSEPTDPRENPSWSNYKTPTLIKYRALRKTHNLIRTNYPLALHYGWSTARHSNAAIISFFNSLFTPLFAENGPPPSTLFCRLLFSDPMHQAAVIFTLAIHSCDTGGGASQFPVTDRFPPLPP